MAKRKAKKDIEEPVSGRPIKMDTLFSKTVEAVQARMQKKGMLVGHNPVITVLPVPAFIIRYLYQNEGLPLSCIYQIVGPQASYKSTFAIEKLRWHRLCGGGGMLAEAETKPTPELRNSVLNWDTDALHIEDCNSAEDWQSKITWFTRDFQKRCEAANGPGRIYPWCAIVDSLTGKASEKTLQNIAERGYAGAHYPVEARNMADFMRAHPQLLLGWPFTFVGVNHLKLAKQEDGSVDYNIPGGWALKFQCSAIIEMERMGAIKEFNNYKVASLRLHTIKNSYGPDNIRAHVRFKTWYNEDAPGVMRLHSRFEWWEASINFIATGMGLSAAKKKLLVPKMQEACDVHEKSGGSKGKLYWSKALGVTSADAMSGHDLGMLLEANPDVLSALYDVTGVQRRHFFRPGVDFMKQLEDYAYIEQQADAADDKLKLAQALQAGIAVEPSVAPLRTMQPEKPEATEEL